MHISETRGHKLVLMCGMASKRNKAKPPIKMPFWKKDGDLWYAERAELEAAIQTAGHSEENLKRKLGAGYGELLEALKGKRLSGWSVSHLEWGLTPDNHPAFPSHSFPPRK